VFLLSINVKRTRAPGLNKTRQERWFLSNTVEKKLNTLVLPCRLNYYIKRSILCPYQPRRKFCLIRVLLYMYTSLFCIWSFSSCSAEFSSTLQNKWYDCLKWKLARWIRPFTNRIKAFTKIGFHPETQNYFLFRHHVVNGSPISLLLARSLIKFKGLVCCIANTWVACLFVCLFVCLSTGSVISAILTQQCYMHWQ